MVGTVEPRGAAGDGQRVRKQQKLRYVHSPPGQFVGLRPCYF